MKRDRDILSPLPRNTARPFYQQIKDSILENIRSGEWSAGEKMPSENKLVDQLGVSRMTVNRALRELTQQGHLKRVHGVGTFVAEPVRHASLVELKDIAEEIRGQGRTHRAEVRHLGAEKAGKETAARMELEPGARVFRVTLVHFQDELPIQLEDRFVNPAHAPGFMKADFSAATPTQYLIALFRPDEMEHVVQAIMPDAQTCKLLAIARSEPCLRLLRRTWKDAQVVTTASLLYPGSRYDLVARYRTRDYPKYG